MILVARCDVAAVVVEVEDHARAGPLVEPQDVAEVERALVVLDGDPLATPPEELSRIQVVATMVGGRWVHNPPPWD